MKQNPDNYIAFIAADQSKDLRFVGLTKRKLAGIRLEGLLRCHGYSPRGWSIEATITLPDTKAVREHVRRQLYHRVGEAYHAYFDSRSSLTGREFGALVLFDMTDEDAKRLMASVRADMNQFLAASAVV